MEVKPRKNVVQLYRCPKCGCVCDESSMLSDEEIDKDGEAWWSTHICPNCKTWYDLSDYEKVER